MHSRFEVCLGEHERGKGDDMESQANVNKNAIQVKKVYPLDMLAKFEAPPGSPPLDPYASIHEPVQQSWEEGRD
jgi:hypothetical protein